MYHATSQLSWLTQSAPQKAATEYLARIRWGRVLCRERNPFGLCGQVTLMIFVTSVSGIIATSEILFVPQYRQWRLAQGLTDAIVR